MPEDHDWRQLGTATVGLDLHAPIPLSRNDLRRHLYVIGKTGTGKSTLLYNLMLADLDRRPWLCAPGPARRPGHGRRRRNAGVRASSTA